MSRGFKEWLRSDNVLLVENGDKSYWTTQDAQYRNKLHSVSEAWNYYKKEII